MIHYITIDCGRDPHIFDSRTKENKPAQFKGARSHLHEIINRDNLDVICIQESHLPEKVQIVCWFEEHRGSTQIDMERTAWLNSHREDNGVSKIR